MPQRPAVFDADEVQFRTRRRAVRLSGLAAATVVVTLVALLLTQAGTVAAPVAGGVVCLAWVGTVWWTARERRRLRRVMWCVKLSREGVEGYDYARRRLHLPWEQVRRVELVSGGLHVVGPAPCSMHVPALFPEYVELGHQVAAHAEARAIPICIDGRPYEQMDLYGAFPDLAPPRRRGPSARGTAHGSAAA